MDANYAHVQGSPTGQSQQSVSHLADSCPNCGRCPHCGHVPTAQPAPWPTYPYWYPNYGPVWVTHTNTGTASLISNS